MSLFERSADKNIKRLIADNSYMDLNRIGHILANFISYTTGEEYLFQPDAVMYSVHSIKDGEEVRDEHVAIHYILIIKANAKLDKYIREYNQDLSDIEKSKEGIILFKSNADKNINYGDQVFTYPDDANGRKVDSSTREFPFYYIDSQGELRQTYENLGLMYAIIDSIIEKRVELEMTEIDTSLYSVVKQYIKNKNNEGKNES